MASTCRTCQQPVRLVETGVNRHRIRLDAEPTPHGAVVVRGGIALPVGPHLRPRAGEPRYQPHQATCPRQRQQPRRRRHDRLG
jgi:hypothetical protein